jgi:hypothetical protein
MTCCRRCWGKIGELEKEIVTQVPVEEILINS